MAFDAPARTLFFSAIRPEGVIAEVPVSNDLNAGAYVMGPGTLRLVWTGQIAPQLGFHIITAKEFSAVESTAVHLTLTASTNLPTVAPSNVFFRAQAN